jgi:transcriptional regulator with XRE-family HTH domain
MKYGERIRYFRRLNGVNQKECAKRLGISQGYLSQIEIGFRDPSREFLIKFKREFNVLSDDILDGGAPQETFIGEGPGLVADSQKTEYEISGINRERRLPENIGKRRLINNVIKIMDSGNKTVTDALEANIKAFLLATKTEEVEIKGGD